MLNLNSSYVCFYDLIILIFNFSDTTSSFPGEKGEAIKTNADNLVIILFVGFLELFVFSFISDRKSYEFLIVILTCCYKYIGTGIA